MPHVLLFMCYITRGHTAEGEWLSRLCQGGGWGKREVGGGLSVPLCICHIRAVTFSNFFFFFFLRSTARCRNHCSVQRCTALVSDSAKETNRDGEEEELVSVECCVTGDLCIDSPQLPPSPLSSATHSPPTLDHLLPVQRFWDRVPSNHWMRCLSALCVYMSLRQGRGSVLSPCRQLPACSLRVWPRHNILQLMSERRRMHDSRSIFCLTGGALCALPPRCWGRGIFMSRCRWRVNKEGMGGGVKDEMETRGETWACECEREREVDAHAEGGA